MHGAIFLYLKTEGEVQARLGRWVWHAWGLFLVLYMLTTIYTLALIPRATANFEHWPWAALVLGAGLFAPLFTGGRLAAQVDQANANQEAAMAAAEAVRHPAADYIKQFLRGERVPGWAQE